MGIVWLASTVATYSNAKDAAGKYGCYFGLSVTGGFDVSYPRSLRGDEIFRAKLRRREFQLSMGQPFTLSATIEARNLPDPVTKLGAKTENYFWDPVTKSGLTRRQPQLKTTTRNSLARKRCLFGQGTPVWEKGSYTFGRTSFSVWRFPMAPMTRWTSAERVRSRCAGRRYARPLSSCATWMLHRPHVQKIRREPCQPVAPVRQLKSPIKITRTKMRFGRLWLDSAYGSEYLGLEHVAAGPVLDGMTLALE